MYLDLDKGQKFCNILKLFEMNKADAIQIINNQIGNNKLSNANCNYSKINKGKEVWWCNIGPLRFEEELNLLLASKSGISWLCIPKNSFKNLSSIFKIRLDKNVVDLEISSDRNFKYLQDVKSGGTGINFKQFLKGTFTD